MLNASVIAGSAAAIAGSILVSLNTDFAVSAAGLPEAVIASVLRFRLAVLTEEAQSSGSCKRQIV